MAGLISLGRDLTIRRASACFYEDRFFQTDFDALGSGRDLCFGSLRSHVGLKILVARRLLIGFRFKTFSTLPHPRPHYLDEATLLISRSRLKSNQTKSSNQFLL